MSQGEYVIVVERYQHHENPSYRQDLEEDNRRIPLRREEGVEEGGAYRRYTTHHRKEDEGGEAIDLRHIATEILSIILEFREQGYERGGEHLRYRGAAHLAPLVGLGIDTERTEVVERPDHKGIDI